MEATEEQEHARVRRATRAEVDELSRHIRLLSDELATDREARRKSEQKGYSVTHLHVPLPIVLGLIVMTMAPTAFVIRNFYQVKSHVENAYIHVDERRALTEGGVAYVNTVHGEENSAHSDLEARDRRTVRVLKDAKWDAKAQKLNFKDPELLPLRP